MASIKKATENKSERHVKINLKTTNQKNYSPCDENNTALRKKEMLEIKKTTKTRSL